MLAEPLLKEAREYQAKGLLNVYFALNQFDEETREEIKENL